MKHTTLIFAATAVLALAACQKQAPVEPAAPNPEATAPTPAPAPVAAAAAPGTAFDVRAFAGRFGGTLPCADCPGIDTVLDLAGDGSYRLDETYQGHKDAQHKSDGTWTAEENGKHLRLDPNSKQEEDRLFEVVSQDEIRMLDREGKPIESQLPYSLKRTGPTQ